MDLVAGHYTVDRGTLSPLRRDNMRLIRILTLGMTVIPAYFAMKCKLIFCCFEPCSLVDSICAFHLNTCTFFAYGMRDMVVYV